MIRATRVLLTLAVAASAGRTVDVAHRARAQDAALAVPRSLADVAPAPIPDEQNAAAHLEALAVDLRLWEGDYFRFCKTPLGQSYEQHLYDRLRRPLWSVAP